MLSLQSVNVFTIDTILDLLPRGIHSVCQLEPSVISEYIVVFKGYYTERARSSFIGAALKEARPGSWKILPRHNILSKHPSDFDVLKV